MARIRHIALLTVEGVKEPLAAMRRSPSPHFFGLERNGELS